jgi:hypothetical protein
MWIRKFWPDPDQDQEKIIFDLDPGSSRSETNMKQAVKIYNFSTKCIFRKNVIFQKIALKSSKFVKSQSKFYKILYFRNKVRVKFSEKKQDLKQGPDSDPDLDPK